MLGFLAKKSQIIITFLSAQDLFSLYPGQPYLSNYIHYMLFYTYFILTRELSCTFLFLRNYKRFAPY